ncbi:hypothetical protein GF358_03855 [Candidatus Woesearchaeota archaeon]|nr:hypothetical protein [Candidatus Woesearchaeota archaeon]
MSIFEKLGLKKKKESEDISHNMPPSDIPPAGDMPPMREHAMPRFEEPAPAGNISRPGFEPPRDDSSKADLINAKLDAIKAVLENINNRIARLEKIAAGEEETPRWR